MSTHGKTVRIYLADGSPAGIRHAEVVNWTGQAIVCPRGRVGELSNWPESQRPGVYILLGENPENSKPMAYIGEAEHVHTRLKQHVGSKDFWDQVVFFTSKDENLTKSHVKYLESRMVELASTAKRMDLENGNAPNLSPLPRPDRDAMEEFLGPARILLGALGFNFLEPVRNRAEGESTPGNKGPLSHVPLYFKVPKRGIEAEGTSTDEGFIVAEGSIGSAKVRDTLSPGYAKRRAELIEDGTIAVAGDQIRFNSDVLFSSPSAAAATVCGGVWNGRNGWRNEQGTTLGDLEEALAGTTETTDDGASV